MEHLSLNPDMESEPGVIALSCRYDVMGLNPSASRILGRRPEPGDHFPVRSIFSPQDREAVQEVLDTVLSGGAAASPATAHVEGRDGRRIFCRYSAHPIYDHGRKVIGVILSFEPVKSPANLAETPEQTYCLSAVARGALVESLPEGVFTVDTHLRVTSFNQTAEEITGFERKRVIGRKCANVFKADRCRRGCPLSRAMDSGETSFEHIIRARTRTGSEHLLVANVSPLKDANGAIVGAIETFRPLSMPAEPARPEPSIHVEQGIIGRSERMRELFRHLPDIAASGASVLITGESGTGKDLVARTLHLLSSRRKGPYITVNCAALAETLLESELFGHEKGAFTGADRARPGRFEASNGGTLFLDEIAELKPDLQVKLLRVLENRVFERVGGNRSLRFDARIISATNRNLSAAMKEGRFREDLYYRLRTVPVAIPPLRDRPEDIPLLVEHFIRKFNTEYDKHVRSVDPKLMDLFLSYHWPGNVRELERCIEYAFVFTRGPVIFRRCFPDTDMFVSETAPPPPPSLDFSPAAVDRDSVMDALARAGGRRREAAELLGISRTSMWRRMKEYGLI